MCNLTRIYVLTYAHSHSLSRGHEIAQFLVATVTGTRNQASATFPNLSMNLHRNCYPTHASDIVNAFTMQHLKRVVEYVHV
jgi:hypothetical protein